MCRLAAIAALLSLVPADACAGETGKAAVEAAIASIRTLDRPGRTTLATIWDGNKYVQCRRMADRILRCEAAGALMQPTLSRVLTPERIARLQAAKWFLDPGFGNYVRTFRSDVPARDVADAILAVLSRSYGADIQNLEIETNTVASELCPPRNGFSQNLAGSIQDAASMEAVVVRGCAFIPADTEPTQILAPGSTAADLVRVYGPTVKAEILRLRVNRRRHVFAVFDVSLGYIQCAPQTEPDGFYCEAQSADSWPALGAVLTPERIARLHAAGYADPGRAPNYSKVYPAEQDDESLATEILTLLHDVYGYYGAVRMDVKTEGK